MPYYEIDDGDAEEFGFEGGQAGYEAASATYDFLSSPPTTRGLRDVMVEKGFASIRCQYDGGYDEGFAYFEYASVNGVQFQIEEVVEILMKTRAAEFSFDDDLSDYPEEARAQIQQRRDQTPLDEKISNGLMDLTLECANCLLGKSFGTGDYSLKGQFVIDLKTGQIEDLEE